MRDKYVYTKRESKREGEKEKEQQQHQTIGNKTKFNLKVLFPFLFSYERKPC